MFPSWGIPGSRRQSFRKIADQLFDPPPMSHRLMVAILGALPPGGGNALSRNTPARRQRSQVSAKDRAKTRFYSPPSNIQRPAGLSRLIARLYFLVSPFLKRIS